MKTNGNFAPSVTTILAWKVDLGVGLWAWPLPMDFDRDGDLDLVVSCPDKPSNGLWFFENPSQDPDYCNACIQACCTYWSNRPERADEHGRYGEPRVLRENIEYPDFRTTGTAGKGGSSDLPQTPVFILVIRGDECGDMSTGREMVTKI